MSFNPVLDRAAIHQALRILGGQVRGSGTVYLFGGTALILQGIRHGATEDLDLWSYDNNAEVDAAVQRLKQQHISVDFLDPAVFLPLPPGWQSRSLFAGTFGSLQVYLLDPYAIVLTKISRSQPQDLQDIQLLASQRIVLRDELIRLYQAIQGQLGQGLYAAVDPTLYDGKFWSAIQTVTW